MESIERGHGGKWRWSLILSVFMINVFLPNLLLSYGVILEHLSELGVPLRIAITTPAVIQLTYNLTQCWFKEAADSWGGFIGYRVMSALGVISLVIGIFICGFLPIDVHIYVYGTVVGCSLSLITAQIDAVIFETFDLRLGVIRAICVTGQAIGLCIFPHIIYSLINTYEYKYSYIVYAGVILQVLPLILFLRIDQTVKRQISKSRYSDPAKTYAIFKNESNDNNLISDLQLNDLSKKTWKNPSDDNLHRHEPHHEDPFISEFAVTITPPPSPEENRKNLFGVDILPDIPEESEISEEENESDSDTDTGEHAKQFNFAIKRLSILGDNIDECISNQIRRDSQSVERDYTEIEVTYNNISPVTDEQREQIFNSFSFRCQAAYASMKRRFWMPSYKIYFFRRRLIFAWYNVNDTFIKPMTRSLSCWQFYPCLLLNFARWSLVIVVLVTLPALASQIRPRISMVEANFSISLYAFTWMCFLLSAPWLAQTKKSNFIHVTVMGLFLSTAACFVLSKADNHDLYEIGCILGGFGYGAIATCWEATAQDFVGVRKWPKINSTLETLSGVLLVTFVIGIGFIIDDPNGLRLSIFILAIILSTVSITWMIFSLISIYNNKVKYLRIKKPWHK